MLSCCCHGEKSQRSTNQQNHALLRCIWIHACNSFRNGSSKILWGITNLMINCSTPAERKWGEKILKIIMKPKYPYNTITIRACFRRVCLGVDKERITNMNSLIIALRIKISTSPSVVYNSKRFYWFGICSFNQSSALKDPLIPPSCFYLFSTTFLFKYNIDLCIEHNKTVLATHKKLPIEQK